MGNSGSMLIGLVLGVLLAGGAAFVFAGDLTPPTGPIAPTFKTIEETPTSRPIGPLYTPGDAAATFVIRESGRYHLTSDVLGEAGKAGIRIEAGSVSLDLNGHRVDGRDVGTNGIFCNTPSQRIEIYDGVVRGWGESGIVIVTGDFGQHAPVDITGVVCQNNGLHGARIFDGGVIRDSDFSGNGGNGLELMFASARDCTAFANSWSGFSVVSGRVAGSSARGNGQAGIGAVSSVIENNHLDTNDRVGLLLGTECRVDGNHFVFNGYLAEAGESFGAAIHAFDRESVVVNNSASGQITFIGEASFGTPARLTVLNNSIAGFDLIDFTPESSTIGPVVTPDNVATNTNPHANYVNDGG
ncbi:MAG: right-handed parallel beta-helix repeat-containing protein [Planctomycetota bacterium]